MHANGNTVAVITARGGSKGLPGKNIRPLGGKPLIVWSIEAALGAAGVGRTLVSTDDEAIAEVARQAGAEVPFLRPADLAGDLSSHYDVLAHAFEWLRQEQGLPETCVLLQPTSPFRSAAMIDAALAERAALGAESLTSVVAVEKHPALMYRRDPAGRLEGFLPPSAGYQRRQDLEPLYALNGALYVFSPAAFLQRASVLDAKPAGYVMPVLASVDIDTLDDMRLAEAILSAGLV